MRKSIMVLLVACFCAAVSGLAAQDKQNELARVAFLKFIDKNNDPNYNWVSSSLPDAINRSMKSQFEFVPTAKRSSSAATRKFRAKGDKYSNETMAKIAKAANSDIIIFGYYSFDSSINKIVINAQVYHKTGNKIIGEVKAKSNPDDKVFRTIDRVAEKIVDQIYRFALATERDRSIDDKTRILVLVPSWKTKKQKAIAQRELQTMKVELSGKYDAKFYTLFEFFDLKKISASEQKVILGYAKKRNQVRIISWLKRKGVKDAFIVLVSKKKVSITPLVGGSVKKKASYTIGASKAQKKAAIAKAAKSSGIKKGKKNRKVSLTKNAGSSTRNVVRLIAGGSFIFGEVETYVANPGVNIRLNANYQLLFPWMHLYGAIGATQHDDKNKSDSVYTDLGLFNFSLGLAYPFAFGQSFQLTPFLAPGLSIGNTNGQSYQLPHAQAGVNIDYFIAWRLAVTINISAFYIFDNTLPALLAQGSLGVGYQL